jgi:hypothetical protein
MPERRTAPRAIDSASIVFFAIANSAMTANA